MAMTTQAKANFQVQGEPELSNPVSVRLDYRARAAIRSLSAKDQEEIHATIDMLVRYGLPALTRARRARRVIDLSVGDGRGPVYEIHTPGATDLRIFVIALESEESTTLIVTDVLRGTALRNAARGF